MLPAIPTPIPMPFAQNGERRAIPETNTVPGSADASWATGFPPVTRINKQAGGKPPYGLDFQGLFHDITEHLCYTQAGNLYPWVGASDGQPGLDYLKGAVVRGSDGRAYIALKPSGPATPDPDGAGMVGPVDPVGDTSGHWADVMAMLGGNLLYNDEALITESGTWEAPVAGWYDILIIGGGSGAYVNAEYPAINGCNAGARNRVLRYYTKGQEVSVTIGAGGPGVLGTSSYEAVSGGASVFDGVSSASGKESWGVVQLDGSRNVVNNATYMYATPTGPNGGRAASLSGNMGHQEPYDGLFPGGGAAGFVSWGSGGKNGRYGNGAQGAVILRFYNPAKAGGPLPEPPLFMARAAARVAAQPAVVNLYDPETGEGSVWLEEDAPAKFAEGLITQEAWQEMCQARAAEERAAWLASPGTEAERFEMLRQARDARLSATDYLVAPDYPLTDVQRAAVTAYRQALRDLPAQEGAPWDGGGEVTPWPEEPIVKKTTVEEKEGGKETGV